MSIGVDIISGIASSALGRLAAHFSGRIVRVYKMESATKSPDSENIALDTAMKDFEVLLGSRFAQLSDKNNEFLSNLRRSDLLPALAESVLLDRHLSPLQSEFCKELVRYTGCSEDDANKFYMQMWRALKASFDAQIRDPALGLLSKAQFKEIEHRLQKIEALAATASVNQTHIDLGRQNELLATVSKRLIVVHKSISVETNRGRKPVDIHAIYVPSRLIPASDESADGSGDRITASRSSRGKRRFIYQSRRHSITYNEFKSSIRRAVVLGDPGGGKSTLCQHLCYDFAKKFSLFMQHRERLEEDNPISEVASSKMPIRVVLRSFESARKHDAQLGLFDYIINDLRSATDLPVSDLESVLSIELNRGGALLAFDGLDEILDISRRRDFVDIVSSFCDRYPLCPVLVTSRIVGYDEAPLPDDFAKFTLEKFGEAEIASFLENYIKIVTSVSREQSAHQAHLFLQQTESHAADLRQNPLMLGLMAHLFIARGNVPSNRPEVYKECAVLMFEKWDQNRNIRADIPPGFDMLHLFSSFAASIYGNPEKETGVSKSWIEQENKRYFSGNFESAAKALEAAKRVTEFITGRSWVMSEFGPNVYRFTHRTFMEYFYALHLDAQEETVESLVKFLSNKIVHAQWDVISHLSLQIKTYRSPARTGKAIASLIELMRSSLPQNRLRIAGFVSRSLEYMVGTEVEVKALSGEVIEACFRAMAEEAHPKALEPIAFLLRAAPDRRSYIESIVSEKISSRLSSPSSSSEDIRLILGFCAGRLFLLDRSTHIEEIESAVTRRILEKSLPSLRSRANHSVEIAESVAAAYPEVIPDLVSIHGPKILLAQSKSSIAPNILEVALASTDWGVSEFISSKSASQILRALGEYDVSGETFSLPAWLDRYPPSLPLSALSAVYRKCKDDKVAARGWLLIVVLFSEIADRLSEKQTEDLSPEDKRPGTKYVRKHKKILISAIDVSGKPMSVTLFNEWYAGRKKFIS